MAAKKLRHFLDGVMNSDEIKGLIQRTPKASLIVDAKTAILNMADYDLIEVFITTFPSWNIYESMGDVPDSDFQIGLKSLVSYFYDNVESKDIAELRKQKLLKIGRS